eukprot:g33690.t1
MLNQPASLASITGSSCVLAATANSGPEEALLPLIDRKSFAVTTVTDPNCQRNGDIAATAAHCLILPYRAQPDLAAMLMPMTPPQKSQVKENGKKVNKEKREQKQNKKKRVDGSRHAPGTGAQSYPCSFEGLGPKRQPSCSSDAAWPAVFI